ncbi:MAG: carbohydrate kinase family protein [Candidatus Micrarchaeota archaeon]
MKFLLVGSATLDVVALAKKVRKVSLLHDEHVEKFACIAFASKTVLDDVVVSPGGSPANSAVTIKRLGGTPTLVSGVGGDLFGKIILSSLKEQGVNTKGVKVFKKEKSSLGVILVDESGEKSVLTFKGAVDSLSEKDCPDSLVKNADVVVLCSLASRKNFSLFKKIIVKAKKFKKKLVFAPSITMLRERHSELGRYHPHFDLVVMNLEEAFYYTGERTVKGAFRKLGARTAVITCDKQGSYAFDGKNVFHVNAPHVSVVDTTGAGDAFTGAFVHSFFENKDLKKALQEATAVAGLKISSLGARFKGGKKEVRDFIKKHHFALYVRKVV